MKRSIRRMLAAMTAALMMTCSGLPAYAASGNYAEVLEKKITVWGGHTIASDVFTEFDADMIAALQKSISEEDEAIRINDKMYGLVFRLDGELPETVGGYNVHYFENYLPWDQAQHDAFQADEKGCFLASYSYYEDFLKYMFEVLAYQEDCVDISFTNGTSIELTDTDSVVILMMEFPDAVQSDNTAKKEYFTSLEQTLLSCGQFSYLGEARRIEQHLYQNLDGLEIICTDADAAQAFYDSDLLTECTSKAKRDNRIVIKVFGDDARELRTKAQKDPRVLSAQIMYSTEADIGSPTKCGFFTAPVNVPTDKGDADHDNTVTIKDATTVLKQYNLTTVLDEDGFMSAEEIAGADVDGDGDVTPKDAMYIQKYVNFNDVLEEPKTWEQILENAAEKN